MYGYIQVEIISSVKLKKYIYIYLREREKAGGRRKEGSKGRKIDLREKHRLVFSDRGANPQPRYVP